MLEIHEVHPGYLIGLRENASKARHLRATAGQQDMFPPKSRWLTPLHKLRDDTMEGLVNDEEL